MTDVGEVIGFTPLPSLTVIRVGQTSLSFPPIYDSISLKSGKIEKR